MVFQEIKQKFSNMQRSHAWVTFGIIILILSALLSISRISIQPDTGKLLPLEKDELVKIMKPSVVRIVQHVSGTARIAAFDIDIENHKVIAVEKTNDKTITLDEYISGSGSIVNPNGYIITNSHVVSEKTITYDLLDETMRNALLDRYNSMSKTEQEKYFPSEQSLMDLASDILAYLEKYSSFTTKSEVVVLNPSSTKENIKELVKGGFPADISYVNDKFMEDQRDVAVIKINQSNLPSISLNTNTIPSIGDTIYIMGFPATADFNQQNSLESTLTEGVVSASKFSDDKNFKIFQTDAKISQGSSGGPMLNNSGEVVGIITFETGESLRQAGDNFGFAIPIKLAQEVLDKQHIPNIGGSFSEHFRKGISLYKKNACEAALQEFSLAKDSNKYFASEQYVRPYIEGCKDRIDQGISIDSTRQLFVSKVKNISPFIWFVIAGRALLILAATWVILAILKRIRKNEAVIEELEHEIEDLHHQRDQQSKNTAHDVPLPLPEEGMYHLSNNGIPVPHPPLVHYIKASRENGLHDSLTKQDLLSAGWKEEDVDHALRHDSNSQ